jgi:hypothetical protein
LSIEYNPPMSTIEPPQKIHELPISIVTNMVSLATSGFGLVVALAWNEFVRKLVELYIDPYLGKNSGLVSLFIYAVIMTILAVFVTMQLTALQKQVQELPQKIAARRAAKTPQNPPK